MKTKTWMKMVAGAVAAFCLTADAARAANLAIYNFTGQSLNSADVDANSTASAFAFASGTSPIGLSGGSGISSSGSYLDAAFTRGTSLSTSEATAVSNSDYYSFTLAPSVGYLLNLNSLTFNTDIISVSTGPSDAYIANFVLRSSVDGYLSNIGTATDASNTVAGVSFIGQTISLGAAEFQGLSSAVTFRLYLYNVGGNNPTNNNSLDRSDLYQVDGSAVAVPEPSTYAMFGAGLAMLWVLRRKKSA